jgi:hypothetical protein
MGILSGHGLWIEVPPRWEGRIFTPTLPAPAVNLPILHLTDTVMSMERSTYAPELAARAGGGGTLVALVEFESRLADRGLYAAQGLQLPLRRDRFEARALQLPDPAQEGHQRFFSQGGRAFCLYVVLGVGRGAEARLRTVNRALATLRVSPQKARS